MVSSSGGEDDCASGGEIGPGTGSVFEKGTGEIGTGEIGPGTGSVFEKGTVDAIGVGFGSVFGKGKTGVEIKGTTGVRSVLMTTGEGIDPKGVLVSCFRGVVNGEDSIGISVICRGLGTGTGKVVAYLGGEE